ncbi:uncharacterized protein LOC5506681 isoform X2 [Nematostella vectensis]|uniref:uncharacterized protein LOC5506681 isoform X2 n=1 Tax=Nematostella vectensis TaxID=45351 RepID=UPI0020775751|nr:uncharacterized protein LOC5506681 isoform X2 [Nematostella vectensis]
MGEIGTMMAGLEEEGLDLESLIDQEFQTAGFVELCARPVSSLDRKAESIAESQGQIKTLLQNLEKQLKQLQEEDACDLSIIEAPDDNEIGDDKEVILIEDDDSEDLKPPNSNARGTPVSPPNPTPPISSSLSSLPSERQQSQDPSRGDSPSTSVKQMVPNTQASRLCLQTTSASSNLPVTTQQSFRMTFTPPSMIPKPITTPNDPTVIQTISTTLTNLSGTTASDKSTAISTHPLFAVNEVKTPGQTTGPAQATTEESRVRSHPAPAPSQTSASASAPLLPPPSPPPPAVTSQEPRRSPSPPKFVEGTRIIGKRSDDLWYPGEIMKVVTDRHQQVKFKVKFDKGTRGLLTSKHIALVAHPHASILCVGSRIVGPYGKLDVLYAGIVAEIACQENKNRFLVFFDDGFAQYLPASKLHHVYHTGEKVWDDVAEHSQEFIQEYLEEFPKRPMVKLTTGHWVKTEWRGKWLKAKVMEIDCSLVKMLFQVDNRTEWIYRGSTRLEPLYKALVDGSISSAKKNKRSRKISRNPAEAYVDYGLTKPCFGFSLYSKTDPKGKQQMQTEEKRQQTKQEQKQQQQKKSQRDISVGTPSGTARSSPNTRGPQKSSSSSTSTSGPSMVRLSRSTDTLINNNTNSNNMYPPNSQSTPPGNNNNMHPPSNTPTPPGNNNNMHPPSNTPAPPGNNNNMHPPSNTPTPPGNTNNMHPPSNTPTPPGNTNNMHPPSNTPTPPGNTNNMHPPSNTPRPPGNNNNMHPPSITPTPPGNTNNMHPPSNTPTPPGNNLILGQEASKRPRFQPVISNKTLGTQTVGQAALRKNGISGPASQGFTTMVSVSSGPINSEVFYYDHSSGITDSTASIIQASTIRKRTTAGLVKKQDSVMNEVGIYNIDPESSALLMSAAKTNMNWEAPWLKSSRNSRISDQAPIVKIPANNKRAHDVATLIQQRLMVQKAVPNVIRQPDPIIPLLPKPAVVGPHKCGPHCGISETLDRAELINHNFLSIPLLCNWKREFSRRHPKGRKEVYYRAPCNRRLKSIAEVGQYLTTTCTRNVTIDQFSFDPEISCSDTAISSTIPIIPDISHGTENLPITVVNELDNTYPPPIDYVSNRIRAEGVSINLDPGFLACCDCTDNCQDKSKCSCAQLTIAASGAIDGKEDNTCSYEYRRLMDCIPTGIYECNSNCACSSQCFNRVVQNGIQLRLQVFKTKSRGWGLRTLDDVPCGTFICTYSGQIMNEEMANKEGRDYGDEYLAELDHIEVVEKIKEGYESSVSDLEDDSVIYKTLEGGDGSGSDNSQGFDSDAESSESDSVISNESFTSSMCSSTDGFNKREKRTRKKPNQQKGSTLDEQKSKGTVTMNQEEWCIAPGNAHPGSIVLRRISSSSASDSDKKSKPSQQEAKMDLDGASQTSDFEFEDVSDGVYDHMITIAKENTQGFPKKPSKDSVKVIDLTSEGEDEDITGDVSGDARKSRFLLSSGNMFDQLILGMDNAGGKKGDVDGVKVRKETEEPDLKISDVKGNQAGKSGRNDDLEATRDTQASANAAEVKSCCADVDNESALGTSVQSAKAIDTRKLDKSQEDHLASDPYGKEISAPEQGDESDVNVEITATEKKPVTPENTKDLKGKSRDDIDKEARGAASDLELDLRDSTNSSIDTKNPQDSSKKEDAHLSTDTNLLCSDASPEDKTTKEAKSVSETTPDTSSEESTGKLETKYNADTIDIQKTSGSSTIDVVKDANTDEAVTECKGTVSTAALISEMKPIHTLDVNTSIGLEEDTSQNCGDHSKKGSEGEDTPMDIDSNSPSETVSGNNLPAKSQERPFDRPSSSETAVDSVPDLISADDLSKLAAQKPKPDQEPPTLTKVTADDSRLINLQDMISRLKSRGVAPETDGGDPVENASTPMDDLPLFSASPAADVESFPPSPASLHSESSFGADSLETRSSEASFEQSSAHARRARRFIVTKKSNHQATVSMPRLFRSTQPGKRPVSPAVEDSTKRPTTRSLFGEEHCYVIDAKAYGNCGRYLNHSCSPNLFVQNVFIDTHDLRFPWVAFFAQHNIPAGSELTWDYMYEVGSVQDKELRCYCGSSECRGRLL